MKSRLFLGLPLVLALAAPVFAQQGAPGGDVTKDMPGPSSATGANSGANTTTPTKSKTKKAKKAKKSKMSKKSGGDTMAKPAPDSGTTPAPGK